MTVIVIGSEALAHHFAGRVPNDLDIVGTYDEIEQFRREHQPKVFYPIDGGKKMFMKLTNGKIVEADIAWPDSVADKLRTFILSQWDNKVVEGAVIPSFNVLYMLKMSHRYLKDSPHFLKTMEDIWAMRNAGAFIDHAHQAFYQERMADTYTYKHPKLDVNKSTFFDAVATGVEYTYDHDSIHEAVKTLERPAYTYFKEDQSEVKCSRDLFEAVDYEVRLRAGMEEAMVLAIERSLVPFPDAMTPKEAFDYALMKVCTSITSGWFREFCWENYWPIQFLYAQHATFFEKFKEGVDNGTVKPYTGSLY